MVERVAENVEPGHNDEPGQRRPAWNADAAADYPVGPDDAGNAVMHGVGFVVAGWRWLVAKLTKRS